MTAKTQSGIPLQAFYTSKDCNFDIPDPGEYPFVRGIFAELYSKKPWTIRQYSGFGSAKSTNQRFQELIREGQEGLSVAFDLPTQMGLDPDDVRAEGEVGKVGVSVATLDDFELLFESIPLDKVSVSMTINATAPILMAFLVTTAKRRGVDWSRLRGTVQNDILKEFIARGTYIYPLDFSLRLASDLSEFCIQNIPGFNWSSISGYHMREAGANAVQELAFTFLNFIVYVEQLLARGIEITKILRRTSFFFDCLMDFFEEIAKFRAARKVYASLVKDRFGCEDQRCQTLRFHTQTGGSALTAQGYFNNIIRACLQSLAAVLGGTQSLHCSSFDEALGLPTEESALVALRTQQIIRYETGIVNVTDPLGGSYYVEWLTQRLVDETFKLMADIQNIGIKEAIARGYVKSLIEESAYETQKRIENEEQIIVGVNKFQDPTVLKNVFRTDPTEERLIIQRLKEFKKNRDLSKVKCALRDLERAKHSEENLMTYIIRCVESNCTLGEISKALS